MLDKFDTIEICIEEQQSVFLYKKQQYQMFVDYSIQITMTTPKYWEKHVSHQSSISVEVVAFLDVVWMMPFLHPFP